MNERLLQFLWQFQYFDTSQLSTPLNEPVHIIHPGLHNTNQGPDFTDAKIRIGDTTWAGSVELHLRTSDWERHGHEDDSNFKNVILHVVWEDDPVCEGKKRKSGKNSPGKPIPIPLIELKGRVPRLLLSRYEELMHSLAFIPCEQSIRQVKEITWKSWKERLIAERLLRRSAGIRQLLSENNFHWEETFWWMLARSYGMKVNADTFEAIARSIPLKVLSRHKSELQQLEALLFGQAGLLERPFTERYPRQLQEEYRFLKKKLGLIPVSLPLHFLRMRPGNFPTVRLAQLAKLIFGAAHLFSRIRDASSLTEVQSWFDVTASDYWHHHYRFGERSTFKKKRPGQAMVDTIIVNTVAPVLFAYGHYHQDEKFKEKALQWLEETGAEKNSITHGFEKLGISNRTALDSQALIELRNGYCNEKRCLECAIGYSILRQS